VVDTRLERLLTRPSPVRQASPSPCAHNQLTHRPSPVLRPVSFSVPLARLSVSLEWNWTRQLKGKLPSSIQYGWGCASSQGSEQHDTQNDDRICRSGSDCRGSISDGRIRSNLRMG
jgi:hypothetical protein